MRELRAITEAVRGVFERDGYGEVWTPALEYEDVLARGGGAPPAYRVFDDHGEVLALRTDMTVPIARLVATRYADRRAAAALLLLRPRLPRRARRTAGRCASSCRPGSSSSARPRRRAPPRRSPSCATRSTPPGCATTASASATPRCTRRCSAALGVPEDARATPARDARRRATSSRWSPSSRAWSSPTPTPSCSCASRSCAAARRCSTPATGPSPAPSPGCARLRAARARGRRARHLRPRARPQDRLLHGRGLRGLRPGAGRADRRRRALRRPARALRPSAAGGRLRAVDRRAAHRADGRGARDEPRPRR